MLTQLFESPFQYFHCRQQGPNFWFNLRLNKLIWRTHGKTLKIFLVGQQRLQHPYNFHSPLSNVLSRMIYRAMKHFKTTSKTVMHFCFYAFAFICASQYQIEASEVYCSVGLDATNFLTNLFLQTSYQVCLRLSKSVRQHFLNNLTVLVVILFDLEQQYTLDTSASVLNPWFIEFLRKFYTYSFLGTLKD
jgi:hypothetical protein